jgi:sodium-independent sulfate anion transporter 11
VGPYERRIKSWLGDYVHRCFTRKLLHKRIPILEWGPNYNVSWGIADLLAGITVGLTVIPQAIAYANIAGLPAEFGLYSSFVGCFLYSIFGSCRDSAIGPTAIAAILTRENIHELGPEFAILLCFISGCVELLMGILQLGEQN